MSTDPEGQQIGTTIAALDIAVSVLFAVMGSNMAGRETSLKQLKNNVLGLKISRDNWTDSDVEMIKSHLERIMNQALELLRGMEQKTPTPVPPGARQH